MERQVLVFDADDTLWENNKLFERVVDDYLDWLAHPTLDRAALRALLDDVERATIAVHGYGSASFLHSLHVCFERLAQRPADDAERAEITRLATALVDHDVELMPGVADALAQLATRHDLLLLTKGQAAEQQRKIDASGIAHHFRSTHIVAEKAPATYRELRRGAGPVRRGDVDDRQLTPLGHRRRPRRGPPRGVHPAPVHLVVGGAGDRPGRRRRPAPRAVPRAARALLSGACEAIIRR